MPDLAMRQLETGPFQRLSSEYAVMLASIGLHVVGGKPTYFEHEASTRQVCNDYL